MRKRIFALLLILSLTLSLAAPALAAESAATIRLSKTTGTVTVSKSSGKSLSLLSNMRLYNGYHVTTSAKSYAWMNLDDTKLIKEDAASEVEVRKSGKKLEVNILSGSVFFDVSEKLEDDESLNISTSTMITGIRGTAGYIQMVDRWTVLLTILEGEVQCSVIDPVTGQVKTESVRAGETVRCVVYPPDTPGDKCDILREKWTVDDLLGFVLYDIVRDIGLCDRIEAATGTDILEELAKKVGGDPSGRSADGQSASPEVLGETTRRQSADETDLQQRQEAVNAAVQEQETGSSADKVFVEQPPVYTGPVTVTRTMPITAADLQSALNGADVVTIQASGNPANDTLTLDTPLTVAAGKTLILDTGVNLTVDAAGSLQVNGTLNSQDLTNSGAVTVNSSNTLHVQGALNNNGTLTVTSTGRLVVDGTLEFTGEMPLMTGAQVWAGDFGEVPPSNWGIAEATVEYQGRTYYQLEYFPTYMITLDANGGSFAEGVTPTLETATGGVLYADDVAALANNLTPRTASEGASATYELGGWSRDPSGGSLVDFGTETFSEDTTLYAVWAVGSGWDYTLSTDGTTLTIFGIGDATKESDYAPWWSNTGSTIQTAIIEGGITNVMQNGFEDCSALQNVTIPNSVISIERFAFSSCTSLTALTIPSSVEAIAATAFNGCNAINFTYDGIMTQWTNLIAPDTGAVSLADGSTVTCTDGKYTCNLGEWSPI